jgi:prepilin-type N-terminal cleavage/methylation domain-containing protein
MKILVSNPVKTTPAALQNPVPRDLVNARHVLAQKEALAAADTPSNKSPYTIKGSAPHCRGFTLIELLATIAIIGVLAAIIFVTIGVARGKANHAESVSNLRQIGAALQLYISDHNGLIMPRAEASDAIGQNDYRYWHADLYSLGYVPDKSVFYDPTFPPYNPENSSRASNFSGDIQAIFGMRDWIKPGADLPLTSRRLDKPVAVVQDPANFFIIADSIWLSWETQGYGISPNHTNQKVRLNEQGTATALFLDGNVQEMPADYFLNLGESQGEYSENEGYGVWHPNGSEPNDGDT